MGKTPTDDAQTHCNTREEAMKLAKRLDNLGTETAFAVSEAAAAWGDKGHKVYSFHLGDLDIPTPHNIVEAQDAAIANGKTGYAPAAGIPPLRDAIAQDVSARRNVPYHAENVVVQPGGKPVVTKFIQALMNPGDEVLYPNPGYPIYESQIEYHGGVSKPYRFVQGDAGFHIDMDYLKAQITPSTRILIFNNQQNPLGTESSHTELQQLAEIALQHDLLVLSDEAYFEMRYTGKSESIVSLPGMHERTVILYTFSKKYAMTGWRLGAAIAPKPVAQAIARLNTNDESCTAHFVQWAGVEALRGPHAGATHILQVLEERRDVAFDALQAIDGVVINKPETTFYLFPNFSKVMQRMGFKDVTDFANAALTNADVSFCTRKHFGRPQPGETEHYIRLAYSGISTENVREGLGRLKKWIDG
jgi:aspartate/methionine/tyrosine aminotransferase